MLSRVQCSEWYLTRSDSSLQGPCNLNHVLATQNGGVNSRFKAFRSFKSFCCGPVADLGPERDGRTDCVIR